MVSKQTNILYPITMGWFIGAKSKKPIYDPGLDAICPFCGVKLSLDNVQTFNLMAEDRNPAVSFFYRCHKTCHERAPTKLQRAFDVYAYNMVEMLRGNYGK
jgi:hypothetical protein